MLDLRKLEYLVAVAEEGSLTAAAQRLHLSQQALSGSMQALEREVGVELFSRRGGGIKMLPAGQTLIEDSSVLHGLANAALLRARRSANNALKTLQFGHTPAITALEVMLLIHRVRRAIPDLSVNVSQRCPGELEIGVLNGEIDVGLCRGMQPRLGVTRSTWGSHRLRIAVSCEHHLATKASIQLSELAAEVITVWGNPGASGYTDHLIQLCRDAGFQPTVRRNPIQGTPPVTAVIGTSNVAFVTEPPGSAAGGLVRVLELTPPAHVPVFAMSAQHIKSATRDEFFQAAAQQAAFQES